MITIVKVKYSDRCVTLHLDSGETLRLPLNLSGLYNIQPKQEIDTTEYRQLKDESMRFECRQKALNYLAMRSRSTKEITAYLQRKNFDSDIIDECIQRLKGGKYLDDLEYARQYVRNKTGRKSVGKNLLIRDLIQKGIPKKIINRVVKESIPETDMSALKELAEKKYRSLEGKKNRAYKLSYFLHQRGFDSEDIRTVIDMIDVDDLD